MKTRLTIKMPFFDIYGNGNPVQLAVKQRQRLMKNNAGYRQLFVEGPDHQFEDSGMILAKRIYSWLTRVSPGLEIQR